MRALRGARDRARRDPPQRGPRGAGSARARLRGAAPGEPLGDRARVRLDSGPCSPPTRRCRPATTAIPGRAGRGARPARLRTARRRPSTEVIALGRTNPEDAGQPFGVTQAALRLSRAANAVSRRHGEVAREMWHALWPDRPVDEVPIGHVTNGVHFPTWVGAPMRELLDRHLGAGLAAPRRRPARCGPAVDGISDAGAVGRRASASAPSSCRSWPRAQHRDRLAARRLARVRRGGGARRSIRDVLTIGFARRVATYKRLELLMRDPDWTLSLLGGERPVQVVLAGKAHPRDEEAKRSLQRAVRAQARADHRRARGVPGRLRPGHRRPARARLRRVAEPAAPAAGGQRHERDEVRDQRRRCSSACSTAGGPRPTTGTTAGRSPARSTPITTPRTSATPPRCTACSSEEVLPAFYERDERGLPVGLAARGCAPRCARSARGSAPRGCSAEYAAGPYRSGSVGNVS